MTIARTQMNRQLYQRGGNTLPIYPRIEAIETSLGGAEERIGDPALGQSSNSPLSNVYNNQTSGTGIGSIFGNTGGQQSNPIQPGGAVDPIGSPQQPSMQQPIPLVRDYGSGNQLPPGSTGFPFPKPMQQPIQPGPSVNPTIVPNSPYESVIMGPDGNLTRNPNPPAPGQVLPSPQIDPNIDYGFNQYGFDSNLLNYLNRNAQATASDAGRFYKYNPTTQTFSSSTPRSQVNQYENIPLSVLQQVATNPYEYGNLLQQYKTGGGGFGPMQQFSYGGRAGYQEGGRIGYQEGGIGMMQDQGMYNPLQSNYYSGMPMMMAGGGIANLVDREKYGLGSSIKKAFKSVAKAIIPKELDPVLKIAAPFLGPVYGPIASIAGSARSGKIDPFSLAAATLPYLQFNPSATGISSLMPTGYGGSQYGIFGGDYVGLGGQGTSLSQMIGNKAKEFLSTTTPTSGPINLTPTQVDLTGIDDYGQLGYKPGYTVSGGGPTAVGNPRDVYDPTIDYSGAGTRYEGFTSDDLLKTAPPSAPIKEPGYMNLIKRAGSFENVPLSERFNAVKDLSTKALKDIYTKPVINPKTGETTYALDKNALFSTFAGASSYIEALQLAKKAGVPEGEFSEADYQRLKIDPKKKQYAEVLKPESFGIRPTAAGGGLMNEGVLSIKLTPAQAMARGGPMGSEIPVRQNQGGISELDLRAKGGYIPVGIKEKADDVPAMLSRNEFVFTADAVRGAGNGSINKGAQKMYKLMKSLEKKVKKMK